MLTVDQAWNLIAKEVQPAQAQKTSLLVASGAVLAVDVSSPIDSPPFDKSMMDGYAVRSSDFTSESVQLQVIEDVHAGQIATREVMPGTCIRIMTGAPVPAGADAVVPVEWTTDQGNRNQVQIEVRAPIAAGWNLLSRGEMMRKGESILPAGRRLRAQEIALLAEIGFAYPEVRRPPSVAILATGDELVDIEQTPGPGQIRNTNALMLATQVEEAGGEARVLGIARDDRNDLRTKIQQGLESDFLCLSGGVSAGEADFVPSELHAAGVVELFHKVAIKPGKPIWFGKRPGGAGEGSRFVFGLPGNPVSSMVCFELFVRTALRSWMGLVPAGPNLLNARLDEKFKQRGDRHLWFPSSVREDEGQLRVRPTQWKGSADLRSSVEANCSLSIPPGEVEWEREQIVQVLPWGRTLFFR